MEQENSKFNIDEEYKPLYTTKKRFSIVTGGRGSLKSHSVHDFILRLTYEQGQGVLFTRYTMTSAEKSIIPEFKLALERLGVEEHFDVTKTTIVNKITNSFIWFSGIKTSSGDQTGSLKSLSGITTWVIEEGEDFRDESKFDAINKSIRTAGKQNRVIWVMNPTTPEHFIYNKFFKGHEAYKKIDGFNVLTTSHPKVEHIHTTYLIGRKYLSDDWLEEAEYYRIRAKEGKDIYSGRILNKDEQENAKKYYINQYLGGWRTQQEGVIFTNWEHGEFTPDLPYIYGLDFGVSDPDALVRVAIDKRNKLIYLKECIYQNNLSTNQLNSLVSAEVGRRLIVADLAGKRTIKDFKTAGLNITKCKKGSGSVVEGIKKMLDYTLIIDGDNLTRELNNYVWMDKKGEYPCDEYNHLIDAARYAITHLLRESRGVVI